MFPNQCFSSNYDPCRRIPWLFSERFDPRVSVVHDYPELWVCEGRRSRMASQSLHSPLVTNAAHFPPSPLLPPVRLFAPSSGTSSIRVKIRTADQFARLKFFDPLLVYDPWVPESILGLPHVCSLFVPYGLYETMIKRARARRRVGRRIERLRCLEVADSMMVTFRCERRCFSRLAYLKRDPQARRIINDPESNPLVQPTSPFLSCIFSCLLTPFSCLFFVIVVHYLVAPTSR